MAGIIDEKGIQWERCTCCNKWARIDNLGYAPPSKQHPHGQDLCITCVNNLPQQQLRKIQPATSWKQKIK